MSFWLLSKPWLCKKPSKEDDFVYAVLVKIAFTCLGFPISWLLLIELNRALLFILDSCINKRASLCLPPSSSPKEGRDPLWGFSGLKGQNIVPQTAILGVEYFSVIILDVNNKRMASEISTRLLNLEKFIIPGLKFALRALVICGLFNITKIFTKKIYIIYLIPLVFSNSELL